MRNASMMNSRGPWQKRADHSESEEETDDSTSENEDDGTGKSSNEDSDSEAARTERRRKREREHEEINRENLRRLASQADKLVLFLTTGLRSMARAGVYPDTIEILAERLEMGALATRRDDEDEE
jgi:hypothetical protein